MSKQSKQNKVNETSCSATYELRDNTVSENHRNRIVFHLFYAPMALLVFIGVFIHQCVIIPTVCQLLFCITMMCLSIFILNRGGCIVFRTLKEEDNHKTSFVKSGIRKKLLAYYTSFLLIAFLTIVSGAYLNTRYLDKGKAESNWMHFEQILRISPND